MSIAKRAWMAAIFEQWTHRKRSDHNQPSSKPNDVSIKYASVMFSKIKGEQMRLSFCFTFPKITSTYCFCNCHLRLHFYYSVDASKKPSMSLNLLHYWFVLTGHVATDSGFRTAHITAFWWTGINIFVFWLGNHPLLCISLEQVLVIVS